MATTRSIISAYALPITIHPANETYTHITWGLITRNVTVLGAFQSATPSGMTVSAYWSCSLHYRWSYMAHGTFRTRMTPWSYSATMAMP